MSAVELSLGKRTATAPAPARPRRRLALVLAFALALGLLAGLATGAHGFSPGEAWASWNDEFGAAVITEIRLPRTLGALLVGGLLGLAGALAQGLFRNPLADPYLLGSAAGSGLAVVALIAGASAGGATISLASLAWLERIGLLGAALLGALAGVGLTLALARGALHTTRLLLGGVVVSVLLAAVSDLITVASPEALRGKQAFMLGSTSFIGVGALATLGAGLALLLGGALRLARALDALTLGDDCAATLGIDLARCRRLIVVLLATATALAVAHAGIVAFVGLVAPHLVRRHAPGPHRWLLAASAAMGGALLVVADVLSRALIAPQELPVGVVTAVLGGGYLLLLLWRRALST